MDSLLIVGSQDQKLVSLLSKLGYSLTVHSLDDSLSSVLLGKTFDLILIDGQFDSDAQQLCDFFRAEDSTKQVPMILLGTNPEQEDLAKKFGDRLELVPLPYSVGSLAGKIATKLRLRKLAGADEQTANLGEMNARLRDLNERFQHELQQARAIQESLRPAALPGDQRFDIAVSYEPLEEVGGDWYYIRKLDSGKISVQIADVTGHGLAAAFIGSITKLAMTAANRELPHELLKDMNRLMASNIPAGTFVTMFTYLYDPESGRLDYGRAGHPPALYFNHSEGQILQLKGEGFAIGFFDDSEYTAQHISMGVGDVLVTFTDAIPESKNRAGQTYDYTRPADLLKNLP